MLYVLGELTSSEMRFIFFMLPIEREKVKYVKL